MQGTLDKPPIVIKQDQSRIMLYTLLIQLFGQIIGINLWNDNTLSLAVRIGWEAFFGAAFLAGVWNFARPGTLTLDKNGLTQKSFGFAWKYKWSDFTSFIIFSPLLLMRQPGCLFSEAYRSQCPRGGHASFKSSMGSFGGSWEMSAQEIVDLLNAARTRWSGP